MRGTSGFLLASSALLFLAACGPVSRGGGNAASADPANMAAPTPANGARAAPAEEPRCAGDELRRAQAGLTAAKAALDRAIAAITAQAAPDVARLRTWLGVRSSAESDAVKALLRRARAFADGVTFRCAVRTDAELGDYYAYVDPQQAFVIVLGHFYFVAPDTGFSSKPGVIVHELTHFTLVGATQDPRIYGTAEARTLAQSNPAAAQRNAENYEYFVESVAFGL